MDHTENYKELFDLLREKKYKLFEEKLNKIDDDFIFDINIKDKQNNYFMTYAVSMNNIDIIKLLIKKGANVDISDKHNRSIILTAINYSFYEVIELLLAENKNNVGINIVDMKDNNFRIPLHHAIEIKNIEAINLLLKYGSNVNTVDKHGNNSLHIAVMSRSLEICEMIVKYITNIDSKRHNGESSIHISCNLQLEDITRLLIKNNININVCDYSHEITPVHYCVLLNEKNILNLLIDNNVDPNVQDIYGNTPLHYSIIENNFEIFMILTKSKNTKNMINMNMWNLEGEIPLHNVFKNNSEHLNEHIDIMLNDSNLSIQDSDGNTCLHFICTLGNYKEYESILVTKRLNIFIKNSSDVTPLDILSKNISEYEKFIDIVVDSYLFRLRDAKNLWHEEWENICSKDFINVTNNEVKILEKNKFNKNKKISEENYMSSCGDIIKNKLKDIVIKIKNNEIECHNTSYPMKKTNICVKIIEGASLDFCTFTGSTLDILIGLIYLLKKHKNSCGMLTKNFAENKELCKFYKSMGILMNSKCEFLNFEIVWINKKLHVMNEFQEQFTKCKKSSKRFIIIPLGIEMNEGNHAGYLIYDKLSNEIERFEPHGASTPPGLHYNPSLLDKMLKNKFKTVDDNLKYISPKEYLPKVGFQSMDIEENDKKRIGDPGGFCALWCIWYVDMRLTYDEIDRKKLVKILMKTVRSNNVSFKNMIRNYGANVIEIRDKILRESDMNVNDWLNDKYTDVKIKSVMSKINEFMDTI
jgi:ankyrin repeat protein